MQVIVIIVTYNGMKWLDKCLASVYNSDIALKVVLIDNGSSDGTLKFIKENYPKIKVINSGENLGFGRANNIGIEYALEEKADYAYLLNQDAYLEKDTISTLISISQKHKEYGILSPMQMNGDGSALDKNFQMILPDYNESSQIINTTFVMAAHWLITKDCIKKVGLFDPIFGHYGEDNDYINRAIYHGFKIGICPNIKAFHDRFFREITNEKALDTFYRSNLSVLTNINLPFIKAIKIFLRKIAPRVIRSFLNLRSKEMIIHIFQFSELSLKFLKILSSRKKNKKVFRTN